jgi:protocatechuate 3,4-dioxygenase, alpha subunit
MTPLKQTPSQTVGPYFAYALVPEQYSFDLKSLFTSTIAEPDAAGEHITVMGNVYDGNGQPVSDALIEMTQPNADGDFVSTQKEVEATGFRGFARVGTGTDPQLRFIVETVKPGSAGPNEAPHIDVTVLMRGMLLHAYTRIYFEDEAEANTRDTVLAQVSAERRATLVAKREGSASRPVYRFNIHMQGPNESVFFDV